MKSLYDVEVLAYEPRTSLPLLQCALPAVRALSDLCNLRLAFRGLGAQGGDWGIAVQGVVPQGELSGFGMKFLGLR